MGEFNDYRGRNNPGQLWVSKLGCKKYQERSKAFPTSDYKVA
jgi:hypothetical protein